MRLGAENVDARDVGVTPIQLVDDTIVVLGVTAVSTTPGPRLIRPNRDFFHYTGLASYGEREAGWDAPR